MKVLFFSHQAGFVFGGEIVTMAFMRELRRVGVEVHFASPPGPYFERAKQVANFAHEVSSVQFSRKLTQLPAIGGAMLATRSDLLALCRRYSIEVVHATSLKAMAYCAALGGKVPVLWHHHDILPPKLTNKLWMRALGARASVIVGASLATNESLINAGIPEEKVRLLRNGFPVQEWQVRPGRIEGSPVTLGFIGELSHRKGVDRLLPILEKVTGLGEVKLVVVGEGLSDPAYAARMKAELAAKGAELVGMVKETKPLYPRFDLLLVPSRQDPLPTVVVEALLSGVPVIGARNGGIPEMFEHGKSGFLFDTEEEAAIGIGRAIERWREMSAAAREFAVATYDLEKITRSLMALYEEISGGR